MLYKNSEYRREFNNTYKYLLYSINDSKLIEIFSKIDKSSFLPNHLLGMENCECLLYFKENRFILEDSTLLFMLRLANIKQNDKVLLIGSDLGFSISILSKLTNNLICIEEDQDIIDQSKLNLEKASINNIKIINSKFIKGYKQNELYNTIIINGACLEIQKDWIDQIKNIGSIVGIKRENNISNIFKFTKKPLEYKYFKNCNAPYLKGLDKDVNFKF